MAREKFLHNLQKVAGFLSPELHVNGIRLGPDRIKYALDQRKIPLWPIAVDGFDPSDFPDLAPEVREQLERDIKTVRDVATPLAGLPAVLPAAGEKGLAAFVAILTTMQPYLAGFNVYAALKRQQFPDLVRDFAVKVGKDSTGDPSAWVWVVVDDREAGEKLFPQVAGIRELVADTLYDAGINLYPYVRFRTETEQTELERSLRR